MIFTMAHLIEEQREFQRIFIREKYKKEIEELTDAELAEIIQKQVQAIQSEANEFLNKATNWKDHRAPSTLDRQAALEEHVDIGKYWLNLFIYMNIGPHEFMRTFSAKSELVKRRWEKEFGHGP